jgi:hypothetical protein
MSHYSDFGRTAMMDSHSVFKTHSIPPAAYYGPGIPPGVKPEFRMDGDVCAKGLWDEAVDEPIAYPFAADSSGFCYIPRYGEPNINHQHPRMPGYFAPGPAPPPLAALDPQKPRMQPRSPCGLACKWTE